MNINTIKNLIAVCATVAVVFFVGAFSADAAVIWADGNVSFANSAGVGQCSMISVGNHTTQEGVLAGSNNEPCWATSISPVQPGQEFALIVKYKNIGNEDAKNVIARITPNGSSSPTTSRQFSVTVTGKNAAGVDVSKTDSVNVQLASAQTITLTNVTHYPAAYTGATGAISQSGLFGAGALLTGKVSPNQFGYIVARFVVSNTQVQQAPTVTTKQPSFNQSTVTFNGNCDSNGINTSTWFEYQQINGATQTTNPVSQGTACGDFDETRTLSAGSYQYRAVAQSSAGTSYGSWISFTIAIAGQAPTITTQTAIVPSTAGTGGLYNVKFMATCTSGNAPTTVSFEYKLVGGLANATNPQTRPITSCGAPFEFQTLAPGLYEYRGVAWNMHGQDEGAWVRFNVPANAVPNPNQNGVLDVVTLPEGTVTTSTAVLQGRMNDNGAGSATGWFIYASDEIGTVSFVSDMNFTCRSNTGAIGSTPAGTYGDNQVFSRNITGLVAGDEYKYRACAEDINNTTDQGAIERFTTDSQQQNNGVLDVSTSPESNIDADSATLNGYLVDNGAGGAVVSFVYAGDQPGLSNFVNDVNLTCSSNNSNVNKITLGGTYGDNQAFARTLTGLSANTAYKYRACAEDSSNATDQGAIERFRTDDDNDNGSNNDDGIKTLSASNIGETSAYLNGTIDQGDNFDSVWFVLSRTDSTPDCDSADQYNVSGSDFDEGDDFEERVTGLRANTKYYVRACAERDGDEYEGSVKNFTTGDDTPSLPNDGGVDPVTSVSIQTLPTTGVTQNNAIINGAYNANGCTDLRTYFLMGTTPYTMTTQTSVLARGNTSGIAREELGNLTPGASYYTQFVGVCKGKLYNGDIKSFTVPGVKIETPTKVATPKVITNTPTATITDTGTGCLDLMITNDTENVTPGQPVTYRVNWKNTCTDLENAILSVQFPKEIAILTTSHGQFAGTTENAVIMELDKIRKDEDDFAIITGTVARNAKIGELVVVQADFGARGEEMNRSISATAFDVDQVFLTNNTMGAFALGAGFLGGPWGWLIALLVIGLIILLARLIYVAGAREQHRRGVYAPVYTAAGHQYPGAMYHHNPQMTVPQTMAPLQMPADPNAYTLYRPTPPTV